MSQFGLQSALESERYEAKLEGGYEANIKTAKHMRIDGELSLDKIAKFSNLPIEKVEELERESE